MKKLASIFAALIAAAAFSIPAQAQRGGHFGGARMGGAHVGGAHIGGFSGARMGGFSAARVGGFGGARIGAAPFSGARVAATGRGIYRGGVWRGRYGQYGYRYGRYGYRHGGYRYGGYWPYWGWGGALAWAWPYYDYGYYDGYGDDSAVAYCVRRFKSYDPASGTYLGYDGRRHACP